MVLMTLGAAQAQLTPFEVYKLASVGDKAAIQRLTALGQAGNAEAEYWLGGMYYLGEGVPKDLAIGIQWYQKAAGKGYSAAREMLESLPTELKLRAGGGDAQALAQLKTLADKGDSQAQSALGFIYYAGFGVPRDTVQAVYWYRKAALQGDAYSAASLGDIYATGDGGMPKDVSEAVSWRKKAAEGGNRSAQQSLGEMYAEGTGVPKDLVLAYMWCNLAAADTFGEVAKMIRDRLEKQMTPDQIAEAQRLSREWKPKEESAKKQ